MESVNPDESGTSNGQTGIDNELIMLRTFAKMQMLNNRYRKDIQKAYDLGSNELNEDLLNNKVFGIVTDGINWNFVCYSHYFQKSECKIIHCEKI